MMQAKPAGVLAGLRGVNSPEMRPAAVRVDAPRGGDSARHAARPAGGPPFRRQFRIGRLTGERRRTGKG